MSGGGSKPKGGKMGTSIRAANVSGEDVASAERKLSGFTDKLNTIRKRMMDAVKGYQDAENNIAALEMNLAKSQKEVMLISESCKARLWSCWCNALSLPPFFYRLTV